MQRRATSWTEAAVDLSTYERNRPKEPVEPSGPPLTKLTCAEYISRVVIPAAEAQESGIALPDPVVPRRAIPDEERSDQSDDEDHNRHRDTLTGHDRAMIPEQQVAVETNSASPTIDRQKRG